MSLVETIITIVIAAVMIVGGVWAAVIMSIPYPPLTPYDDPDFD